MVAMWGLGVHMAAYNSNQCGFTFGFKQIDDSKNTADY